MRLDVRFNALLGAPRARLTSVAVTFGTHVDRAFVDVLILLIRALFDRSS